MKNIWILMILLSVGLTVNSQKSNLVFYSEQGDPFYLYLNSVQQNVGPLSNVMISDLPEANYKLRIQFEDAALGEISKNLMFGQGTETSYVIRQGNNDEWVIRYVKEVPVAQAPAPPADRSVIVFRTEPPVQQGKVTQASSTTTTATTTVNETEEGGSMGVSVSDPSTTVIINMNVGGVTNTSSSSSSTSTSVISSSTTTTVSEPDPQPVAVIEEPMPAPIPGYSGPIGCQWPMSPIDFTNVKNSISSKAFEDSKYTIAKQVLNSNCLLTSQVKEIMLLFSFEETRLDFAKFAYGRTYDIGNYYQLNDAFTFESTIDELNEYIESFRW